MEFLISNYYLIVISVINLLYSVDSQSNLNSSLTFVIDSTKSMWDDIDQVKKGANAIFDTVVNSNASQIEEFILVIFRDPDVHLLTTTKDRTTFKTALASIKLIGNWDCPEMSMAGIEKALIVSQPGSYLYVFTDAAAKDYDRYETVRLLATEKGCQIVFILTGECSENAGGSHEVYYTLAKDTHGQVFNLYKHEVGTILNYVKETITSRKIEIFSKTFPPGSHTFYCVVDSTMKELVVSVSGNKPKVGLIDPEGVIAATEDIVRTSRIAIVKVTEVKPGVYTAEISSNTNTSVVVSGTNTVNFQHGFSVFEPTAIEETATQPIPDVKSFLSIKLATESNVELQAVQIMDMNQNIITEMPLELINVNDQFYVTEDFVPPNKAFRIAIKGYDVLSKTIITRFGLTPIEPQNQNKITITNRIPRVSIIGESKVNVIYDDPLQLRCKVSAYPKPDIFWEDDQGVVKTSTVTEISVPYDYLSVLEIAAVNKNNTYTCKARNDQGDHNALVTVMTKRTKYFDILETPTDGTIEHDKEARFVCKINALPPVAIKWLREGKRIRESDYFHLSSDNSTLTIIKMQPFLVGKYACKAKNYFNRKIFKFKVSVSGVELPKIDKKINEIYVREGSDIDIVCRVIQGKPKPTVHWLFMPEFSRNIQHIVANETIHLKNVSVENAGTFRCEAVNAAGEDYNYYNLFVEYPPTITETAKIVKAVDGEKVVLPCDVEGMPVPEVKWLLNGIEIKKSKQYRRHHNHSLSFTVTLQDGGTYTCIAENKFGAETKTTIVYVNAPPKIDPPTQSTIEIIVGTHLTLECQAHGYPEPSIQWIFYSIDYNVPPKVLKSHSRNGALEITRIQIDNDGYYVCIASNSGGSANTTYDVRVMSPPYIENIPEKTFKAVLGDLVLRIPCKVLGSPKPEINWKKDYGIQIAKNTEWYNIDSDGTLFIKDVDDSDTGIYQCVANNKVGSASETYDVIVESYPQTGSPTQIIDIEEGKSSIIKCDVPHKKTDVLRWFKNNKQFASGELILRNVTTADSGLYTCRVSNFYISQTGNTYVKVGFKPRFLNQKGTHVHIEFEEGLSTVMDCSVSGQPPPEITWWHDNKQINENSTTYILHMKQNRREKYICVVKNMLGYLVRTFEISSKECILSIKEDFEGDQPLLTSVNYQWPLFDNTDGFMRVPPNGKIILSCPDGFVNFKKTEVIATCEQGSNFEIEGRIYKFSDIKCQRALEPIVKETGFSCWSGNTEIIQIGYNIRDIFLNVYEVCFDKDRRVPLYAKHSIHRSLALADVNKPEWFHNQLVPIDFNHLYNCDIQLNSISSVLRRWFHREDKCCFAKKQLVGPRDVLPGLSQAATFSYLNTIPHWSTCNSGKNWEAVARRVRRLVRSTNHSLLVWTGTSQQLQIKGLNGMENIFIRDNSGHQQPVAKYIWKVVQDQETQASLAIVQINVPDLRSTEVNQFVLCPDICNQVTWMKTSNWHILDKGYVYCCNIRDFETAFNYIGLFNSGMGKVLYDV